MASHRFSDNSHRDRAVPASAAFIACPAAVQEWIGGVGPWQQQVYALALTEAIAVVRPSIIDRFSAVLEN
jgi:hypothetical protein